MDARPEFATDRTDPGTVPAVLAAAARKHPSATYLMDGDIEHDFASVAAAVDQLRGRLAGLGIGPGDRVVLWLPNGIDWINNFYAVQGLGAVVITAGTRLKAGDVRHLLADSEAKALIYTPKFLAIDFDSMAAELLSYAANGALPRLRHVLAAGESGVEGVESLYGPADPVPVATSEWDPAVVCYTSGSTGEPKGCLHTHASLVENARVAAQMTGLEPGQRIACPVPFAHVFGFHMGVLQAATAGATLVNAEPYEPEACLDVCAASGATVLYAVPTMARDLVAGQRMDPRPLGLRLTLLGGAPASPALRLAITANLSESVGVVYGCTEAPTISQLLPADPPTARMDSVGRPTPGVEVRIAAGDSVDGLDAGEIGEILSRGHNTMRGYMDAKVDTEQKFREGWLVTGDLGWLDSEGFLHVAGRADDTLLVGGFNAYPREIEARLEQIEGVLEAAVIGVPDERLGQVPMAWIGAGGSRLDADQILNWAIQNLASYKRPRYVEVLPRLPRVGSGKIARADLVASARTDLPDLPWEETA